jgi:metal-responsive CopG/Arc/MetJ family transcriptional regulator
MRQRRLTVRIQVELSKDELKAIDDFWFAERLPSRAAAVRELLRRGITVQKCTANRAD